MRFRIKLVHPSPLSAVYVCVTTPSASAANLQVAAVACCLRCLRSSVPAASVAPPTSSVCVVTSPKKVDTTVLGAVKDIARFGYYMANFSSWPARGFWVIGAEISTEMLHKFGLGFGVFSCFPARSVGTGSLGFTT